MNARGAAGRSEARGEAKALVSVAVRSLVDARTASVLAGRAVTALGGSLGVRDAVAIVVGELASNIARHAERGRIVVDLVGGAIRIVADDVGPGIADPAAVWRDGHSRGRLLTVDDCRREGLGCGLGAVKRLMDEVTMHSVPGTGTKVTAFKRLA